jgi:micrococcal nuclease
MHKTQTKNNYLPKIRWLISLLIGLVVLNLQAAQVYTGKVIHISNGDTIKIVASHQQIKIRLAEIDTPEKGQPYGNKAKKALGNLIFGKVVTVHKVTTDRYKRIVGKIYLGDVYVNAWMVENGHAWFFRKYGKDLSLYDLENEARTAQRGLWADANPVPPWEWRRDKREGKR